MEKLHDLQRRLTVLVLSIVLLLLSFQLSMYFADLIRILGISILLSYLFINVVDFLEGYVRSRAAAILLVYVVLGTITIFGVILVVPALIYQVSQMVETIWHQLPNFVKWLGDVSIPFEARLHAASIDIRVIDLLNGAITSLPKPDPTAVITRLTEVAMSTMTWLFYAVSIFVVSFYFLLEGHRISDAIVNLFPKQRRGALHLMVSDMDKSMQAFFRGQLVLGIMAGIVMLGVYAALGVPYALALSVFLALWEVVPVIGPPIGFYPALVPVAIHGMNHFPANRFVQILALVTIFNVLQWAKDNIIAPRYIGKVIGVHPILIFIAILIGARLDGLMGIIFALPAACLVNVFAKHYAALSNNNSLSTIPDQPSASGDNATTE